MGREAHPEVRKGSEGPTGGPGGDGWPTRSLGSGRRSHAEVREMLGGLPGDSGGVGRDWEVHPKVQEGSGNASGGPV